MADKYLNSTGLARAWSKIKTYFTGTATPGMDGTASVGTSSKFAREDHVHPSDTSKVDSSYLSNNYYTANYISSNYVNNTTFEDLSDDVDSLANDHVSTQDVNALTGRVSTIENSYVTSSDFSSLSDDVSDLSDDVGSLQSFQQSTSSWMSGANSDISSLMSTVSLLGTSLASKVENSTFNTLSDTTSANTAAISNLSSTVSSKADGSTVTTLTSTVNTISQNVSQNSSNITSLSTELNGTSARVTATESDILQLSDEISMTVKSTSFTNLSPMTYSDSSTNPKVSNGVTWTLNSDNTVSAAWSSVTNDSYYILSSSFKLPKGTYTLSGCPSDELDETCFIELYFPFTEIDSTGEGYSSADPLFEGWYELQNGNYIPSADETVTSGKTYYRNNTFVDYGTGVTFEVDDEIVTLTGTYRLGVRKPSSGGAVSSVIFEPMLEVGTDIHEYSDPRQEARDLVSKINMTPESITINANKVNLQGYVTASSLSSTGTTVIDGGRIQGGTITLGGLNNGNGLLEVRDSSNNLVGRMNNEGLYAVSGEIAGWDILQTGISSGPTSLESLTQGSYLGPDGLRINGVTIYYWVVWAYDSSGTGISLTQGDRTWFGMAKNTVTPTPSLDPTLYQWAEYEDGMNYPECGSIMDYAIIGIDGDSTINRLTGNSLEYDDIAAKTVRVDDGYVYVSNTSEAESHEYSDSSTMYSDNLLIRRIDRELNSPYNRHTYQVDISPTGIELSRSHSNLSDRDWLSISINDIRIHPRSGSTYSIKESVRNITRNGTTFTATRFDGTSFTFDQQDTTYSDATTSQSGLMSSTDKTKLNGIETGAQVNSITGVKGNVETDYRTGNVNLTPANIGAVPTTRTVNSHALSSNISLTASDVGAVPTTRTVNSHALSSNISLTASDVGAVPTTRTINSKALSSNISLTASDVGAISTDDISRIFSYSANLNANSSRTYTVSSTHRGLMIIQRGSASDTGLYSIVSSTTGAVYVAPIKAANNVTVTTATNKLTLQNTGSSNYYVSFIGNYEIT